MWYSVVEYVLIKMLARTKCVLEYLVFQLVTLYILNNKVLVLGTQVQFTCAWNSSECNKVIFQPLYSNSNISETAKVKSVGLNVN